MLVESQQWHCLNAFSFRILLQFGKSERWLSTHDNDYWTYKLCPLLYSIHGIVMGLKLPPELVNINVLNHSAGEFPLSAALKVFSLPL